MSDCPVELKTDKDARIADLAREMYRAGQALPLETEVITDWAEQERLEANFQTANQRLLEALAAEANNA